MLHGLLQVTQSHLFPLKMKKKENTNQDSCVVISGMVMLNKTETLRVRSEIGKSFAEK